MPSIYKACRCWVCTIWEDSAQHLETLLNILWLFSVCLPFNDFLHKQWETVRTNIQLLIQLYSIRHDMTVTWQYEVHVKCMLRIHKATTIDRHTHQQYSDKPNTKFEQDLLSVSPRTTQRHKARWQQSLTCHWRCCSQWWSSCSCWRWGREVRWPSSGRGHPGWRHGHDSASSGSWRQGSGEIMEHSKQVIFAGGYDTQAFNTWSWFFEWACVAKSTPYCNNTSHWTKTQCHWRGLLP